MAGLIAALLGAGCPIGCAHPPEAPAAVATVEDLSPPASAGAFAPEWAVGEREPMLTWLEPSGKGHRLAVARLSGRRWGEPATVAAGNAFFANWADFPAAATAGEGSVVAHWLEKNGESTYAYGVQLAHSTDGGRTWERLGRLHTDASESEHGFVSFVPDEGGVRAFWLDGRATVSGGAMSLATARIADGTIGGEEILDERVCDCCQTGAAATAAGPLVVFRDRSDGEVRDIGVVRHAADGWTPPRALHEDGWQIPGCPVNGPVVSATGDRLAVAWFTGVRPRPRAQVAFSSDAGATFGEPVVVDDATALGRVDLTLLDDGSAVVSWLAQAADGAGNRAEIRLARVTPDGRRGEPYVAAETSAARRSGFPRLTRRGDELLVAWVEVAGDDAPSHLRVTALPLSLLPAP